jgi:hypothetical protein
MYFRKSEASLLVNKVHVIAKAIVRILLEITRKSSSQKVLHCEVWKCSQRQLVTVSARKYEADVPRRLNRYDIIVDLTGHVFQGLTCADEFNIFDYSGVSRKWFTANRR